MTSFKTALIYGFLVWLIPFMVSFWIFPLRENDRALFESIMPLAVTVAAVIFALIYFKKVTGRPVKQGLILGWLWLGISLIIDLLMFSWGPMKMGLVDYFKDIGLTYLIIPVITLGLAWAAKPKADPDRLPKEEERLANNING